MLLLPWFVVVPNSPPSPSFVFWKSSPFSSFEQEVLAAPVISQYSRRSRAVMFFAFVKKKLCTTLNVLGRRVQTRIVSSSCFFVAIPKKRKEGGKSRRERENVEEKLKSC